MLTAKGGEPQTKTLAASLTKEEIDVAEAAAELGADARAIANRLSIELKQAREMLMRPRVQAMMLRLQNVTGLNRAMLLETLREIMLNKDEKASARVNAVATAAKILGEDKSEEEKPPHPGFGNLSMIFIMQQIQERNPDAPIQAGFIEQLKKQQAFFSGEKPLISTRDVLIETSKPDTVVSESEASSEFEEWDGR